MASGYTKKPEAISQGGSAGYVQNFFDLTTFAQASMALTSVLVLVRLIVFAFVKRGALGAQPAQVSLRPAELAYLLRRGDMSNVIVVLAFDLLHRAAKTDSGGEYPTDLAPYERKIWQNAKDFVRSWTEDKVGAVLPNPGRESLAVTTRKVSAIYRFLSKNVRAFVSEVLGDPKRIKRYISFAGVARFVADLGASGYEQMVESELSADLVSRGLLTTLEKSRRLSFVLGAIGACAFAAVAFMVIALVPDLRLALGCIFLAALNVAVLRLYVFFLELLPLYGELKDVLTHVKRGGWRLAAVRFLLRLFSVLVWFVFTLAILLLLALECLTVKFALAADFNQAAAVIVLISANLFFAWQFVVDAGLSWRRPLPSALGAHLLKGEREQLSGVSPIETLGRLLSEADYDPQFSKLLALYGIETLWLLV